MPTQTRNEHDEINGLVAAGEMCRQMGEPAVKALARSNAEIMSLCSRRAQAYMEAPARLMACRSPQEAMAEQMRFMQTAWTQYSECFSHVMSAYQAMTPAAAGMMQMWNAAARMPANALAATSGKDRRDYLGDGPDTGDGSDRRTAQSRRAAA